MMRNILKLTIAIVVFLAGILLLLKNFGILNEDIFKFWPMVLVIIGGVMLFEYFTEKRQQSNGLF
ncbi:MAG: DUF5668 domain-containing protein [Candidatus Micrarchaeia archaeon]|jgi:hypothetical protein